MAKTTRKTDTTATAPKTRQVRRKPASAASKAGAPSEPAPGRKSKGAAPRPASTRTKAPATPVHAPTHHELAERAYHIYLRRYGRPGNPDHDWLQAIAELRAERG